LASFSHYFKLCLFIHTTFETRWLIHPSWCWYRCPETGTSSIDWGQLSRFHLKTETESSLQNDVFWKLNRTVFLDKDRTMDNVQQHNICTNVPLSQTFRSYLDSWSLKIFMTLVRSFLQTWVPGNWSMKIVPVPCVNSAHNWISLKMFLVIYNKVH
jgi:hypothetical protein